MISGREEGGVSREEEELDLVDSPRSAAMIAAEASVHQASDSGASAPDATSNAADAVGPPGEVGPAAEPDLLSETELKVLMSQFNPLASRDIQLIQKGVENFFLFRQSHFALTRVDQLQHLGARELAYLSDRGAVALCSYLHPSEDRERLILRGVVVRPASLKGEQVARVRAACVRGSAHAVVEFLNRRDEKIRQLMQEGTLGQWVSARFTADANLDAAGKRELKTMLPALRKYSVEQLLSEAGTPEDLAVGILNLLNKSADILADELRSQQEVSEIVDAALASRGPRAVLVQLSPEYHVFQPPARDLLELPDSGAKLKENKSELEWLYLLYVQIARKILTQLLPEEERAWIQPRGVSQDERYLEELKKHPSFLYGEEWPDGRLFVECLEALIQKVRGVRAIRREYLVELLTQESLKKLNMQFEPVLISLETFTLPDPAMEGYMPRKELYHEVVNRLKSLPDVMHMEERRRPAQNRRGEAEERGAYFIYRANMPRAFVRNAKRRTMLHQFCRANGLTKGVYDLLVDVSSPATPAEIVEDQIALSRAIREWEAELEKERRRAERARLGFFGRILAFFAALFGMTPRNTRRSEDRVEPADAVDYDASEAPREDERTVRKRSAGGILKREKSGVIPQRIQKAIDFVERNHKGVIWLDEVVRALNSVKYSDAQIGDYLFYDRENRYVEIKSLREARPAYIRAANESSPAWARAALDYYENIANPLAEHGVLVQYLRNRTQPGS